jgi:hypothetical protein
VRASARSRRDGEASRDFLWLTAGAQRADTEARVERAPEDACMAGSRILRIPRRDGGTRLMRFPNRIKQQQGWHRIANCQSGTVFTG